MKCYFPCLFLFVLFHLGKIKSDEISNIPEIMGNEILSHPTQDSFDFFDFEMRDRRWGLPFSNQRVTDFSHFEHEIPLDIKLVGFKTESHGLSLAQLERLFSIIDSNVPLVSLHSFSNGGHSLPISRRFVYRFSHANDKLTNRILSQLSETLAAPNSHRRIPVKVMDDIIESDYRETAFLDTFYILNLQKLVDQHGPYSYLNDGECKVWLHAGLGIHRRYLWADLTAEHEYYGPQIGGGGVLNYQIKFNPDVSQAQQKNEVTFTISSLLPSLSPLLYAPPMNHFPFPQLYNKNITLQFYVIHDHPLGEVEKFGDFDLNPIAQTLLSLPGGHIEMKRTDVSLLDDPFFASVFTQSLSSNTHSRHTESNYGVISKSDFYLNSNLLHHWINKWEDHTQAKMRTEEGNIIVPVYVFDISFEDLLLIDQIHQAVAFQDMVIAIQTRSEKEFSSFKCSSKTTMIYPRNATRPIIAALLQTLWAIAPTHMSWNFGLNAPQENWFLSLSNSPFTPSMRDLALPFYIVNTAFSHAIYCEILTILREVDLLFTPFLKRKKEIREILSVEDMKIFNQRWNLFTAKFAKVREYLTHHHYSHTFAYLQNCQFDLDSLKELTEKAKSNMRSTVFCSSPNSTTVPLTIALAIVIGPILTILIAILSYLNRPKTP
jgi:hypothetical protein